MSEDIIRLTTDLYAFVVESESLAKRLREEVNRRRVREAAEDLYARCTALGLNAQLRMDQQLAAVRDSLEQMTQELRKQTPSAGRVKQCWASLGENYEYLVLQLQQAAIRIPEGVQLNHFKPRNYSRNLFHFGNSVWGVLLYELVLDRTGMLWVSGGILGMAIVVEIARRLSPALNKSFCEKIFGAVSRPHETHSITSATWYSLALFLGVYFLPQHAIEAGTIALGVGDPAAALAGKAWGTTKIYRDKTLQGAMGFFVTSTVALALFFSFIATGYSAWVVTFTALSVSLASTVTELYSGRIEDNFSIPVVGGLVAALCLAL